MEKYETNKYIPSLSEVKQKEREDVEQKLDIEAKEFLLKVVDYYEKNYPNSNVKIKWENEKGNVKIGKENLDIELKIKTEDELRAIHTALAYFHDERQMPSPLEHDKKNRISSKIHALIPGDLYSKKIEKLKEDRQKINDELEKLEKQLIKDREQFKKTLEKTIEKSKDMICNVCKKKCGSPAGLANHMKTHTYEERKESLPKL